jgi:hypothetical protein
MEDALIRVLAIAPRQQGGCEEPAPHLFVIDSWLFNVSQARLTAFEINLNQSLFHVPLSRVPCRITRKESKHEQQHKKRNDSVNDKFKGYHDLNSEGFTKIFFTAGCDRAYRIKTVSHLTVNLPIPARDRQTSPPILTSHTHYEYTLEVIINHHRSSPPD